MELQTQTTPTPQPSQQSRPKGLIVAIIVVLLIVCAYCLNLFVKQAKQAEELIGLFSQSLNNNQYAEASDILKELEVQGLGIHLGETKLALAGLLESKISDVSLSIMNEKSSDFVAYQQVNGLQLLADYPEAQEAVNNQAEKFTEEYLAGRIEHSQIEYLLEKMRLLGFTGSKLEECRGTVESCQKSRENAKMGKELFAAGDYVGSLEKFANVTAEDKQNYEIAQIGFKQSLTKFYTQVEKLSSRHLYAQAAENLKKIQTLFPESQEIPQKIASLELARQEEEKNLVLYNGPVQHIFFHPLIAYAELTFDGDLQARGFNEWFVTIPEFKKIIKALYSKGFILVNITDLYEISKEGEKETIVPKQLRLPKGKRPMVISIDDLNYYRYMIENGTVHKLILDQDRRIGTYSKNPKGEEIVAYDNEIVPILDSFVEEHPDFSFHGAKGVIALTGYEGILGYRTDDPQSPNFEREKEDALQVVQALKENGWLFASHSQGHLNVREDSYERLIRDTQRWQKEVGSLIGPTDVYIYPFGASVKPEDPKFKSLQNAGFKVFCSVGPNPYLKYAKQYMLMDRRHIDGIALLQQGESVRDLFDSEEIIDPVRPPLK